MRRAILVWPSPPKFSALCIGTMSSLVKTKCHRYLALMPTNIITGRLKTYRYFLHCSLCLAVYQMALVLYWITSKSKRTHENCIVVKVTSSSTYPRLSIITDDEIKYYTMKKRFKQLQAMHQKLDNDLTKNCNQFHKFLM